MGWGSKILATMVVLAGPLGFTALLILHQPFQTTYWIIVGQNVLYASVGVIVVYASIMALARWLWTR